MAANAAEEKGARIVLCRGCGPDTAATEAAVRPLLPPGVDLVWTDCMNVCSRPVTMAARAPGREAYLFAGVDPGAQAAEIAAFARAWQASPDGRIADARPLGQLRFALIGRIPG